MIPEPAESSILPVIAIEPGFTLAHRRGNLMRAKRYQLELLNAFTRLNQQPLIT